MVVVWCSLWNIRTHQIFHPHIKNIFYDKAGTLLKTQEYDVENKTTSDIKKYDYENGKLSKICRIEDNVEKRLRYLIITKMMVHLPNL